MFLIPLMSAFLSYISMAIKVEHTGAPGWLGQLSI